MAKTWFRIHAAGSSSLPDNRKIQSLPPPLFKWLVNLWCFACRNNGILPSFEDIAWTMRCTIKQVEAAVSQLQEKRFIDTVDGHFVAHDWGEHQFETDTSYERVKRFRERKRNVSVTERNSDSETDDNGPRNVSVTPRARDRLQTTETDYRKQNSEADPVRASGRETSECSALPEKPAARPPETNGSESGIRTAIARALGKPADTTDPLPARMLRKAAALGVHPEIVCDWIREQTETAVSRGNPPKSGAYFEALIEAELVAYQSRRFARGGVPGHLVVVERAGPLVRFMDGLLVDTADPGERKSRITKAVLPAVPEMSPA